MSIELTTVVVDELGVEKDLCIDVFVDGRWQRRKQAQKGMVDVDQFLDLERRMKQRLIGCFAGQLHQHSLNQEAEAEQAVEEMRRDEAGWASW